MDPSMLSPVGTVLTLLTQILTLCDKASQLQKTIRPLISFLRLVEEILRDVDEDALAASRASRLVLEGINDALDRMYNFLLKMTNTRPILAFLRATKFSDELVACQSLLQSHLTLANLTTLKVRDRLVHDAQRGIEEKTEEIKSSAEQHKSKVQTIQQKLRRAASRSDHHTRAIGVSLALQDTSLARLPPAQLREEATYLQQNQLTLPSHDSWKEFAGLTEDDIIDHTLVEALAQWTQELPSNSPRRSEGPPPPQTPPQAFGAREPQPYSYIRSGSGTDPATHRPPQRNPYDSWAHASAPPMASRMQHGPPAQRYLPYIGIDLGTTLSCVAVVGDDRGITVLESEDDKCYRDGGFNPALVPSVVAYTDTERLVGIQSLYNLQSDPENTVYAAKRLVGRTNRDTSLRKDIEHMKWALRVVYNEAGCPMFQVRWRGDVETMAPQEVSAAVLSRLKSIAEEQLRTEVLGAVVTVPAYFQESQRQATLEACGIAGLNVIRIINEPTAAVMAYYHEQKLAQEGCRGRRMPWDFLKRRTIDLRREQKVLVFDLGGGTFDVSLAHLEETVNGPAVQVLSTHGCTTLGGADFDIRLRDMMLEDVVRRHGVRLQDNTAAMALLLYECERAKKALSGDGCLVYQSELTDLPGLGGASFKTNITRANLEELCHDYFEQCMHGVDGALLDAKMAARNVDCVLLVGGSTRIPKIRELLRKKFGAEKVITDAMDPDLAVAAGAAVMAAQLKGAMPRSQHIYLLDVVPHDLGVLIDERLDPVITRNSPLPTSHTRTFYNKYANARELEFKLYEGKAGAPPGECHFMGSFTVLGLRPMPARENVVDVTFRLDDLRGTLSIDYEDLTPGGHRTGTKQGALISAEQRLQQETNPLKKFIERNMLMMRKMRLSR